MPNWKKLIVSGSDAVLRSVTVTNGITVTGSANISSSIFFSTEDVNITTTGQVGWDAGNGTLDLGLSGSAGAVPTLNIGQQQLARVYNAQGSQLTKGQVVYVSGSQGNRIAVKLAAATGDDLSAGTLGFIYDTIPTGGDGYVITAGPLYKVDTSAYTAGASIYLSSSAGQFTQTRPVAPIHEVRLGYIERVDNNIGSIYVKVDNGYELDELHDVYVVSPTSGDLLVRSASLWINSKQLTGSYGLTGSLTLTGSGAKIFGTSSWADSSSISISSSFASTASFTLSSSFATTSSLSRIPIAAVDTVIYSNGTNITAGGSVSTNTNSVFLLGSAGGSVTAVNNSIFIGPNAGNQAFRASNSNFLGSSAGSAAISASNSNFLGFNAGGLAMFASHSNFLGSNVGANAVSASFSTLIGKDVGNNGSGNSIGTNNIIIGKNITLENNRVRSINLGGLIFATGSYDSAANGFSGSAGGNVGINEPLPTHNFQVSGTVSFPNLIQEAQTNVLTYNTTSGRLFYTASATIVVNTASFATTASFSVSSSFVRSSSFALSSSFATTASFSVSSSFVRSSSFAISSSNSVSSSYSVSSSFALSSSFATTASFSSTASFISTLRAAGVNTTLQYNNGGLLAGDNNLYWTGVVLALNVNTSYGCVVGGNFGLIGPNDTGLISAAGDDVIAVFDGNSIYAYAGNAYQYIGISSSHQFIGNILVTGSLRVSGSITGSLQGTSSWAQNAVSASYAPGGTPITFINANPGGGSYSNLTTLYVSGSGVTISNPSAGIVSMSISGGAGGSGTTFVGSTNVDNRIITATGTTPELNGEASLSFDSSTLRVTGSLIVAPSSVREFEVTSTGVNIGNVITDVHRVTGSLRVLGSITGSLLGTASFATLAALATSATSATTAVTASKADQISTVRITGTSTFFPTFVDSNNSAANYENLYTSTNFTFIPDAGSITANSFTGSLNGTSSWSRNSVTASTILVYRTGSNATWYIPFVDSVGTTGGTPESLFTTDGTSLYFNPSNGSLTTTSFTGSLLGTASLAITASATPNALITASVSSNVLTFTKGNGTTFNLTVATGSGGGGGSTSPGGSDTAIQFNSGSTFSGSVNLTYNYKTTGASAGRVSHYSDIDHTSPAASTGSGAFLIYNKSGNDRQQFVNIFHQQDRYPSGAGASRVMTFEANGGGAGSGDLIMTGFKCDYNLVLHDSNGPENLASKTGTLWGAWTDDTGTAPVLNETTALGDTYYNDMNGATFTLNWSGTNIQLDFDPGSLTYGTDIYFSGLFTTFGTSL